MLYSNVMLKYCDDDIKDYAHNNTLCRRAALLLHFDADLVIQKNLPSVINVVMCAKEVASVMVIHVLFFCC